ncbi:MAG: hypothetical protein ACLT98_10315 [Eggerthellaceae bacterium]
MIAFDRSGSLTTPTKDWYFAIRKYTAACSPRARASCASRPPPGGMFYRNSYETINGETILSAGRGHCMETGEGGLGDHYGKYESASGRRIWPARSRS